VTRQPAELRRRRGLDRDKRTDRDICFNMGRAEQKTSTSCVSPFMTVLEEAPNRTYAQQDISYPLALMRVMPPDPSPRSCATEIIHRCATNAERARFVGNDSLRRSQLDQHTVISIRSFRRVGAVSPNILASTRETVSMTAARSRPATDCARRETIKAWAGLFIAKNAAGTNWRRRLALPMGTETRTAHPKRTVGCWSTVTCRGKIDADHRTTPRATGAKYHSFRGNLNAE